MVNDPLYNHEVFGPLKGRGGDIGGKTDEQLVRDLINIHNAENWMGIDGDSELSMFKSIKSDLEDSIGIKNGKNFIHNNLRPIFNLILIHEGPLSDDDSESVSREASPCSESPRPVSVGSESPNENICSIPVSQMNTNSIKNANEHLAKMMSQNSRLAASAKVGVSVSGFKWFLKSAKYINCFLV